MWHGGIFMDTAYVSYCPPMEEENDELSLGWEKETVQYAVENKKKIIQLIRSNTRGITNINAMDYEDIYSEFLEYLYKSSDYDIQKATEYSSSGSMVTLEGYVNNCVRYCIKRYITAAYRRDKVIVREPIVDDEGKEKELLETLQDEKSSEEFENICYDVESYLNSIEYKRYRYGADIFLLLYVRILTLEMDNSKYRSILEVLGVPKKDLAEIEKKLTTDQDIMQAFKAVTLCDTEQAIEFLERKVYGAKQIRKTIKGLS